MTIETFCNSTIVSTIVSAIVSILLNAFFWYIKIKKQNFINSCKAGAEHCKKQMDDFLKKREESYRDNRFVDWIPKDFNSNNPVYKLRESIRSFHVWFYLANSFLDDAKNKHEAFVYLWPMLTRNEKAALYAARTLLGLDCSPVDKPESISQELQEKLVKEDAKDLLKFINESGKN